MITLRYRTLMAFAAGLAVALIGVLALQAWRADAAPGDSDTTFVPITPCRIIDTRPAPFRVGSIGAFTADDTKTIQARGTNGNCTIPTDGVGLSLNVTAVDASQPTFLTIWPGGTKPTASSLNPTPGGPPTPNAVATKLSSSGAFNVFNRFGTVEVIIDVNGYYTKSTLQQLAADNAALQSDVADLQTLLASMSLETVDGEPTVRFSGVNLQVVDGTSDTDGPVNGRGNLIVGYNENNSDTRTGSHNLILGEQHTYTSYGGLVTGFNNTIHGGDAIGGGYNTAADTAVVLAGYNNTASGSSASVVGGSYNTASGGSASVTGGSSNTASGDYSSVAGGTSNSAVDDGDSVAGGDGVVCLSLNQSSVCGEGAIVPPD